MQTPVSISFLSVYPHEDEFVTPPLTRFKMKGGKRLVKWVEVKEENANLSRVLSEENEQWARRVESMLDSLSNQLQEEGEEEEESHWEDVPSDEAVCVKVGGKTYQPLFRYPMIIQF